MLTALVYVVVAAAAVMAAAVIGKVSLYNWCGRS